jgi:hypothetical protein
MGFDEQAAQDWQAGRQQQALQRMWALATRADADVAIVLQAMYYMYCAGTFRPAQEIARSACQRFPDDLTLLLNSGVIELRMEDYAAARLLFERYLGLGGTEEAALDGLATACHELGEDDVASQWGARAIDAKTERAGQRFSSIELGSPRATGVDVIAFSLWGDSPRYLRGALHNAIRARDIYPGFTCRFVVDSSVPSDLLSALAGEGAEVHRDDREPSLLRRLARRFLVADDPGVRRYLIRDADSIVNPREAGAVAEWIADDRPFHVMRDWWTHTDPILAGLWGGIAGAFPDMTGCVERFIGDRPLSTNWDQYFLRDQVWPAIRDQVMVHDRCYPAHRALPFPTPTPPGREHVGQNEYNSDRAAQAAALADFAERVPALQLPTVKPVKLQFRTS